MTRWVPDTELSGYQQYLLELPDAPTYALEPEGSLAAVLVRRNEPSGARAVLYVHGWNDYFFQTHLADEMAALGYDFYAVDLRRYGRSLRKGQLAGYITDLRDYFVELDAAVQIVRDEGHDDIVLMGHSTGGLTASLYANERPGVCSALVLNAPWLEAYGNTLLGRLSAQPAASRPPLRCPSPRPACTGAPSPLRRKGSGSSTRISRATPPSGPAWAGSLPSPTHTRSSPRA